MPRGLVLGAFDFGLYSLPPAVTALTVLVAVGLVLRLQKPWKTGLHFVPLVLPVSLWFGAFALMYASPDRESALFWAKAGYLAVPFVATSVYGFATVFGPATRRQRQTFRLLRLAALAFVIAALFGDYFIRGVHAYSWGYYPDFGPVGLLFLVFTLGSVSLGLVELARNLREFPHESVEWMRTRGFLLSMGVASLAVVDFAAVFGIPLYPLGCLFVFVYLASLSRTVWRYRLPALTPRFAAAQVLETMQGAVLVLDGRYFIRGANPSACTLLGHRSADLIGRPVSAVWPEADRLLPAVNAGSFLRDATSTWLTSQGREVDVSLSCSTLTRGSRVVGVVCVGVDITLRRRHEQRLAHDALHDSLTGLPNRTYLLQRLQEALDDVNRNLEPGLSVLFFDLDRFKLINDSLGHSSGDDLLRMVARRLDVALRQVDMVARLGGDEFAILLEGTADTQPALCVAERIHYELLRPFSLAGGEVTVSASIGIAGPGARYEHPEELLRDADIAMYRAKALRPGSHVVFTEEMQAEVIYMLRAENGLAEALRKAQFVTYYQPIMDLAADRIASFETLIRWKHPQRGLTLPAEFLPVAERNGLIVPIGHWLLDQACDHLGAWHREVPGAGEIRLNVNLSAKQLSPGFPGQVQAILAGNGLQPHHLSLELTENCIMSCGTEEIGILEELKRLGVRLEIDDFGTGCSLSSLHSLPILGLKAHRSFVSGVESEPGKSAILTAVVSLAKSLGLAATAEGIESQAQRDVLVDLGFDLGQGSYFSPPVPAAVAGALLRQSFLQSRNLLHGFAAGGASR